MLSSLVEQCRVKNRPWLLADYSRFASGRTIGLYYSTISSMVNHGAWMCIGQDRTRYDFDPVSTRRGFWEDRSDLFSMA